MLRLLPLVLLVGLGACDHDGYHCGVGDEGCTCHLDGDCDVDLHCINGRCFDVPEVKRVFVTSVAFPGDFGGVDAADGECNYLVRTLKLGGKWKAWLSTADKDAVDRLEDESPWYLMDHRTVAFQTKSQLRTAPLAVITRDEHNFNVEVDGAFVWTGTSATGRASGSNCSEWTSATDSGTAGSLTAPEVWTDSSATSACSQPNHVYCFEQ